MTAGLLVYIGYTIMSIFIMGIPLLPPFQVVIPFCKGKAANQCKGKAALLIIYSKHVK